MSSDSSSADPADARYAETLAGARSEYSKEQQDIALAAVALQSGVLSERQLSTAMATWTIHGTVPLVDHLKTLELIDDEMRSRLSQRAEQRLAASRRAMGDSNGSGSKSAIMSTLDAIDPAGTIARLMGVRAAAGAGATDATGARESGMRYRLVRKLGQGGLGRVWLAFDEMLKRHVALKEVNSASDSGALERLRREAEITGRLEHPGIVPIYQLGDDAGTGEAFYAMRFLGKTTLQDEIAEYHERRTEGDNNPMLIRRLLTDFVAICQAIGHAHSRRVIHRDLKPENIAIDSFGQVIVIDWGIAKVIDEFNAGEAIAACGGSSGGSTMEGQVLGTPLYMAPEQAAGRVDDLDERTDIYGLGAILYAILTGYAPHEHTRNATGATTSRDLLAAISSRPTPPAAAMNPQVDRALAAICAKAMARRQYARYASASELADDVQRWMAGETVSAYRESPPQRVARWIAHHRLWSQLIAALLLVGFVALITLAIVSRQNAIAARRTMFDEMRGVERELAVQLTGTADELSKNVLFMSIVPPIQGLIDSRNMTPESEDEDVLKARLDKYFEGLLRANVDYLSATYVTMAPEGEPLVLARVERNAGDAAYLRRMPASRLNVYVNPELFKQALALPPGESLVAIPPAQPGEKLGNLQLAAATPVYDEHSGDVFGVVVLKIDLLHRLKELIEPMEQDTANIYLTDSAGMVLLRDHPRTELKIERRALNVATLVPGVETFFKQDDVRKRIHRRDGWVASRVMLDPLNPKTSIGIVMQLEE